MGSEDGCPFLEHFERDLVERLIFDANLKAGTVDERLVVEPLDLQNVDWPRSLGAVGQLEMARR